MSRRLLNLCCPHWPFRQYFVYIYTDFCVLTEISFKPAILLLVSDISKLQNNTSKRQPFRNIPLEQKALVELSNDQWSSGWSVRSWNGKHGLDSWTGQAKTRKIGIQSFPASRSAIKRGRMKPPSCVATGGQVAAWLEDQKVPSLSSGQGDLVIKDVITITFIRARTTTGLQKLASQSDIYCNIALEERQLRLGLLLVHSIGVARGPEPPLPQSQCQQW